jgi:PTS system mannose-specific IIB component/fructoselysine and glucoselysine-specific PTS system IIB component
VYLTSVEAQGLQAMADAGVDVTAQDVPTARMVPLDELLHASPDA